MHIARAGNSVRELPDFPTRFAGFHAQYTFFRTIKNYSLYQVWITSARMLTNAQVIDLQASPTARFEYIH